VEDHDQALVRRETASEAQDLVMVEEGPERIRHRPVVVRLELDEPDATVSPDSVAAGIYDDPIEPGLECGRVAQRSSRLPCSDGRVVGDVLGIVGLPEDQPGESVGPVQPAGYLPRE
jgi:hypothetical protein